jgi:hypothetical protein
MKVRQDFRNDGKAKKAVLQKAPGRQDVQRQDWIDCPAEEE